MTVTRYDQIQIKATVTKEGWIRDQPVITRAGIFEYTYAKGKTVKEYRSPTEVFRPDSLASLAGIPVTDNHRGLITADNSNGILGTVLGPGVKQDDNVIADVIIHNANALGKRRELSLGYTATVLETPGVTDTGEKYDAIQTDIQYNHLAIVNHGRAGNARLRLDSNDAASFPLEDDMDNPIKLVTVKIDEIEYAAAQEVARALAKLQTEISDRTRSYDTLSAERDGLKGQVTEAMQILQSVVTDSADKPEGDALVDLSNFVAKEIKNIAGRIKNRLALEVLAMKHNVKFDEKTTDRKIREDVISSIGGPTIKFDDKSDEYVESAFDFALNSAGNKTTTVGNQRTTMNQPPKQTNVVAGASSARAKMVASITGWCQELSQMAWPDNSKPKRKPSNLAALRLLEEGYVIVSKYDVPSDVVPFGTRPAPEPYTLDPGESGDVLTRIDSYNFAGHRNWVKAGTPPPPAIADDAPNDGRIYGRQNNTWIPAENAGDIVYIQDWTINAADIFGIEYLLTVPVASLPTIPFYYMASFFVTNLNKTPYPLIDVDYDISIEERIGSGSFIPVANISFNSNILQSTNSVSFPYPVRPGSNRLFYFDPLTAGIRFKIACVQVAQPSIAGVLTIGFNGKVVQFA